MLEIVIKQLLEDTQRSNRMVGYAMMRGLPVLAACTQLFEQVTKDGQWDLNDTTMAIAITDAIYEMVGNLQPQLKS